MDLSTGTLLPSKSRQELEKMQKKLSAKIITKNILPKTISRVCGVDVAYKDDLAYCSAVVLDKTTLRVVESKNIAVKVTSPYIPTMFMLRESGPVLTTLNQTSRFDILLVDGHGRLHPRLFGLACYIGLKIDKPVVGVAKRLLCGKVGSNSKVEYGDKVLGHQIKHNKKKIFVSVGHKISLSTAVRIVKELTVDGRWYPEPLRMADLYSKKFRREG